jgi:hypothetical protein
MLIAVRAERYSTLSSTTVKKDSTPAGLLVRAETIVSLFPSILNVRFCVSPVHNSCHDVS